MNKGALTLPIATVGTIIFTVVGFIGSYYGSINSQEKSVLAVDTKVQLIQQSDKNQEKKITSLESKIDMANDNITLLLIDRGIKPVKK